MCGICGVFNLSTFQRTDKFTIIQMLEMIRHRGPDGFGIYSDENIALGSARLSIIDLDTGDQPLSNEDETLWIVFNGEIFNYIELRQELEQCGHGFKTQSDTETILHMYEEFGPGCLNRLNGQFSIAIWDTVNHTLFLARDRLGIRPLFYTIREKQLIFGSEIKALLAFPGIKAEIDPTALQQVFTFWNVQSPNSIFKGIRELPPGHYLIAKDKRLTLESYWSLDFIEHTNTLPKTESEYLDEFESLLEDAVRIRLRSDVPVGAYLSGGLDSSVITSLVHNHSSSPLETFSISFSDPDFDESHYQLEASKFLGTRHNVVPCDYESVGNIFPEVIWHTETPVLRTAPAPMFLLSKLVHANDFKVVLTGEGADEFLAGYDIFKEMKLRRFWAKNPESSIRPLLFRRIYKGITRLSDEQTNYLKAFFKKGLTETDSPYYSHAIRWTNTSRINCFLRSTDKAIQQPISDLPTSFFQWSHLAQAQYLEIITFLSPYLLSSQGDRMSTGNSVEGRYPYLDYRIVEFCNRLPDNLKLRGLKEKWILKQLGSKLLPDQIWKRAKKPYRAPISQCFFKSPPDYIEEVLSPRNLDESGYFNTQAAMALIHKASRLGNLGEVDSMALAGIISTQLIHQLFVKNFQLQPIRSNGLKLIER